MPVEEGEVTIGWALAKDGEEEAAGYVARVKETWDTVSLSSKATISSIQQDPLSALNQAKVDHPTVWYPIYNTRTSPTKIIVAAQRNLRLPASQ